MSQQRGPRHQLPPASRGCRRMEPVARPVRFGLGGRFVRHLVSVSFVLGLLASAFASAGEAAASEPGLMSTAPTVTSVSPDGGPLSGGEVVVNGTGFSGTTAVHFGSQAATSFSVQSSTEIATWAPAEAAGAADVTVTTPAGTSTTSASDLYLYEPVPAVTSISPIAGPIGGGTFVTVTGSGFSIDGIPTVAYVDFGGTPATSYSVQSATSLTAVSPLGSQGPADVTVLTSGGSSPITAGDEFSFEAAPIVNSVTPVAGLPSGGAEVTVTGSNFVGASGVSFGSTAATSFTVVSPNELEATSPAAAPGRLDISVTTPSGRSATSSDDSFTYEATPDVTNLDPSGGALAGGNSVAITGTGFIGASAVSFGSVAAASFTVQSATSIVTTAPAESAAAVDVNVTTPSGTSTDSVEYLYLVAPIVSAVSPEVGALAGGTAVTVAGSGFRFGNVSTVVGVEFGTEAAATYTVTSSTLLEATSPAHVPGGVDITVITPGGTSSTNPGDLFTYENLPTVTAVSPAAGPLTGASTVTIAGTDLGAATAVDFGNQAATSFTVTAADSLTAVTPPGRGGTVNVSVTTPAGVSATTAADQFTYEAAPVVALVSPAVGSLKGGTAVVITGSNLVAASSVRFGDTGARSYAVVSATEIRATTAAARAGTVEVFVTTPSGTGSGGSGFTYEAAPSVAELTPSAGRVAGGTIVTVRGSDFSGASRVSFGRLAARFRVVSSTEITAISPAESPGAVTVSVTTPLGSSGSPARARFTYDSVPAVTAVSPRMGRMSGGTVVHLSGRGFVGDAIVRFGRRIAADVVCGTVTACIVRTPAGAGGVTVTVTTPGGTSRVTPSSRFTYEPVPKITRLGSSSGPRSGGNVIVVEGRGFVVGATTVRFGSRPSARVTCTSSTTCKAKVPAGVGTVEVIVATPGGTSAPTRAARYVYLGSTHRSSRAAGTSGGGHRLCRDVPVAGRRDGEPVATATRVRPLPAAAEAGLRCDANQ